MSSAKAETAMEPKAEAFGQRNLLSYFLHALNQPLTGLQCSMELAAAGPRPREEYVRVLREGLHLTSRMRELVEAIRELTASSPEGQRTDFDLNELIAEAASNFFPVAQQRQIDLRTRQAHRLPLRTDRGFLTAILTRTLDAALSLSQSHSHIDIVSSRQNLDACITLSWISGGVPEHSPFSRAELALLVARTTWEKAGGEWLQTQVPPACHCTLRWKLVEEASEEPGFEKIGELK